MPASAPSNDFFGSSDPQNYNTYGTTAKINDLFATNPTGNYNNYSDGYGMGQNYNMGAQNYGMSNQNNYYGGNGMPFSHF